MTSLVIDTDPGVDDAQAIMLAFAHPGAMVHALTVVAGNVGLDRTVANACTILDVLDTPPGAPPGGRPSPPPGAPKPARPARRAEADRAVAAAAAADRSARSPPE